MDAGKHGAVLAVQQKSHRRRNPPGSDRAASALSILVGDDGGDDDGALDDFLIMSVDVQEREPRGQHPQDHGADDGSGQPADAAGKRRAANDRGGDRVEFEADADAGLSADRARGVDDAAETREQPASA